MINKYIYFLLLFISFQINAQNSVTPTLGNIAEVIYLSPNGSDTNTGTATQPIATFQEAVGRFTYGTNGNTIYSEIVFLPGYYDIADEMRQACWQHYNNEGYKSISIRGVHRDSVILDGSDANSLSGKFINLLGSGISVRNLTIVLANDTDTTAFWAPIDFKSAVTPCNTLNTNNIFVDSVILNGTWGHGIHLDKLDTVLVSHCEVVHSNLENVNGRNDNNTSSITWGSGIKTRLTNYIEIRDCKVHENWGEGIALARTTQAYVHHNEVYDNFSVNIYGDNLINGWLTNNLCYSTLGDTTYWRGLSPSAGFAVAGEYYSDNDYARSEQVKIFNNIIINCQGFYIDDNRPANEPLIVDFNDIWYCNNTIVGWDGGLNINRRAIRIDFAGYNTGDLDMDSIFLFNNMIAVDTTFVMSSGNGQFVSGSAQGLPPSFYFGYNYWTKNPQRIPTYTYPFDPTTDTINAFVPTQIAPTELTIMEPNSQNNLIFEGLEISFITTDYFGTPRMGNYNAGAILPAVNVGLSNMLFGNSVDLFPNPTKGYFQIENERNRQAPIYIYNGAGRKILETMDREVDLSTFPSGLYFLKVGRELKQLILIE